MKLTLIRFYVKNKARRSKEYYYKDCFACVIGGLTATDLKSTAIIMLMSMLTKYGLDCLDEWNAINTKLRWSEYHYEMQEFYKEVLKKD